MKRKHLVAALAVCTFCLFAVTPATVANSESASTEQISLGSDLFDDFCERCHEDPAIGLADFQGSKEDLVERLEGMTEEMPDFWGMFTDDEIEAIYAYIRAAKQAE